MNTIPFRPNVVKPPYVRQVTDSSFNNDPRPYVIVERAPLMRKRDVFLFFVGVVIGGLIGWLLPLV